MGGAWILMSSTIGQITVAKLGDRSAHRDPGWLLADFWQTNVGWALALALSVLLLVSDALVSYSAATLVWRGLALAAEVVHLLGVTPGWRVVYFATLFWWSTFREPAAPASLPGPSRPSPYWPLGLQVCSP
jgi:hypothetical protein